MSGSFENAKRILWSSLEDAAASTERLRAAACDSNKAADEGERAIQAATSGASEAVAKAGAKRTRNAWSFERKLQVLRKTGLQDDGTFRAPLLDDLGKQ